MNKEELQLGNWIKIPQCEYYHDEDDFDRGYAEITSLNQYELNTTSLKEISYDEVEGIPLTEELLIKIGFKKDGYTNLSPDYYLELEDKVISINIKSGCDKDVGIWVNNKKTKYSALLEISRTSLIEKILYVHQLQNLLTLINIKFLIEL